VCLDNLASDGEAQSGAARRPAARPLQAVKRLEHGFALILGNAGSIVLDARALDEAAEIGR
jgi:hypothetical protein